MSLVAPCLAVAGAVMLLLLAARPLGAWLASGAPRAMQGSVRVLGGLGTLSLLLFLAGHLYWSRAMLLALLGALALWGVVRQGWPRPGRLRLAPGWPWLLIPLPLALFMAAGALVLPSGDVGQDDVAYHLAGPAHWIVVHHVTALVENFPAMYPQLIEMLWGAVMAVASPRAVGLLSLVFAGCLLWQAWGLVRDLGGDSWCASAGAAFLSCMPVVIVLDNRAYVDIAYAAFAILAARLAWAAESRRQWLVAGCFLGFALDIKYTGVLLVAAVVLALLPFRRVRIGEWGWLLLATALVGCPWYVRNWIVVGAPMYPMPSILHWQVHTMSAAAVRDFEAYMKPLGVAFGRGPAALLLLPFHFTYFTSTFHGGGGLGVLPLALGPLALPGLWRTRQGRYWLAWTVWSALLWFYSSPQSRFLIPVVVVWAGFAALSAGQLLRGRPRWLQATAAGAVAISLGYGAGAVVAQQLPWRRPVPFAAAVAFLNRQPNPGGKVLVLDAPEFLTYYLRRDYLMVSGPRGEQPLGELPVSEALIRARALGITEVVDPGGALRPPPGWRLEFASPDARVYAAPPPPSGTPARRGN